MNEQIKSKINFNSYLVESIDFKLNTKFVKVEKPINLEIDFNKHVIIDKEKNHVNVILQCIIFEDYEDKNYPFYLNLVIRGSFSYESEIKEEELNTLIENNTVAILFPYLRSTISIITVNSGISAIIIPTVNIIEFLKEKDNIEQ